MRTKAVADIREYKKELRARFKDWRKNLSSAEKSRRDVQIMNRLTACAAYKDAKVLLTYVSTPIEVDTRELITRAIAEGKTVAVPRCIDGTRDMKFYIIQSLNDLEVGTFSVLEPIVEQCRELTFFRGALCIVPGLAFDMKGYRLGYGKGYYDRFLDSSDGILKAGVCYCACTMNELIRGKYDMPVDILITDKYTRFLGGKDGR